MANKPNHICKNCGVEYYACNDCDRINSWRLVACSSECYQKYINAVLIARGEIKETVKQKEEISEVFNVASKVEPKSFQDIKTTKKSK